jgi:hypothetical protein
MAQIVVESKESRTLSNSGGKFTGSCVFHVFDDTTDIPNATTIKYGANGMPEKGDAFPGESELFASTFSASVIPESRGIWKVTWTYTSGENEGGAKMPTEVGYLQVSMEYTGTFKDMYRADSTGRSLNYQNGLPTDKDIGGAPIDAAGVPTSVFIPLHRLVIEETVSGASLQGRTALTRAAVGKRNSASFYGADKGKLLYEGCSARRTTISAWSLTHKFLYDGWYHMGQQPKMNSQREVIITMTAIPSAVFVRWIQPFPGLVDFNAISDQF